MKIRQFFCKTPATLDEFIFKVEMKRFLLAVLTAMLPIMAGATDILTLQQCRDSAVANNIDLKIARQKITVAGHDRKIAMSNYFPEISVTGAYMYNSRNIDLLSDNASAALSGMGTSFQETLQSGLGQLLANQSFQQFLIKNPELLQAFSSMGSIDISNSVNAIGKEISDALELDIQNVFLGAVTLKQPVFTGGKIIAANKIASLAEDLAEAQYDAGRSSVISSVDNAYWQIVSIAGKLRLARDYTDLLEQMLHDTEILVGEGMATEADLLAVKVQANDARTALLKASNGLSLSKMLLCQLCGLPIDSDIELADENLTEIPLPQMCTEKELDDIFADRPEIRSLELASEIYGKKVAVARADMLPQIALTADYLVTNPNAFHGYRNRFGGMFNVGVAVNIPVIHGCATWQKVRKAKAEAVITSYQLEDARERITLQVAKFRKQENEALEKLNMAESSLSSAEENLRTATVGYTEGVVPANTLLAAQTAWMKAHSEYIDAGVELQIAASSLAAAEGNINRE